MATVTGVTGFPTRHRRCSPTIPGRVGTPHNPSHEPRPDVTRRSSALSPQAQGPSSSRDIAIPS